MNDSSVSSAATCRVHTGGVYSSSVAWRACAYPNTMSTKPISETAV